MGWRAAMVIIDTKIELPTKKLIKKIGGSKIVFEAETTFEEAINPEEGKLYFGTYQGNSIICDTDLPLIFYDDKLSKVEKLIIKLFPNNRILAVNLDSTSNFYGYVLIDKGKKVRVKVGDWERPVILELGQPLEEEKELYKKAVKTESGAKIFKLGNTDEDEYTEDAVGENFVFEVVKGFLDGRLNHSEMDGFYFKTPFYRYVK
jgi:hypothetical protein